MNIPEEQITHSANCVELTGVQQLEARDTYNILGEIGEKTIGVTPPTTTKLQLCCLGGKYASLPTLVACVKYSWVVAKV